jgi:hypothetical protein
MSCSADVSHLASKIIHAVEISTETETRRERVVALMSFIGRYHNICISLPCRI